MIENHREFSKYKNQILFASERTRWKNKAMPTHSHRWLNGVYTILSHPSWQRGTVGPFVRETVDRLLPDNEGVISLQKTKMDLNQKSPYIKFPRKRHYICSHCTRYRQNMGASTLEGRRETLFVLASGERLFGSLNGSVGVVFDSAIWFFGEIRTNAFRTLLSPKNPPQQRQVTTS